MNAKTWLIGTAVAAMALALGGVGCGQNVATCTSICSFPDAPPGTCVMDCQSAQEDCANASASGDFQAALTCVNNAGSYSSTTSECAAEEEAVAKLCLGDGVAPGNPIYVPDSGLDYDSGYPGGDDAGDDASCGTCDDGGYYGDSGYYDGGYYDGGYDSGYYDGGYYDGGYQDGGYYDAVSPPIECAVGAPCGEDETTCVQPGAGPCGSDEQLICNAGQYFLDYYPCNSSDNCGYDEGSDDGGPGCSETCTCENGNEICSGTCGDAGVGGIGGN